MFYGKSKSHKARKEAVREVVKFVVRTVVLVGVPTVLTQIVKEKPEWGVYIGAVLVVVDKAVHELPNEYKGLLPF